MYIISVLWLSNIYIYIYIQIYITILSNIIMARLSVFIQLSGLGTGSQMALSGRGFASHDSSNWKVNP